MTTNKSTAPLNGGVDMAEPAEDHALQRLQQAQAKMQEGVSSAMKYWQSSMAFGQGQLTALTQSTQIMATGLQEITKHISASHREAIEDSVAFTKSLMAAKTPQDAAQLQAEFVKARLVKNVAQNRELSQATAVLAKHAVRPINEQIAKSSKAFQNK
jgi:phasin family protein